MTPYGQLAARVGLGDSKIAPRLFEMLSDGTDAELLLAMPGTVPELSEKLGMPEEDVETRVRDLFLKGLAFPSRRTDI